MRQMSKTWWGQRFIAALESFTESGRLGRGRSYARGGKIKHYTIEDGLVSAQVRGSVNPYFGVYKEPLYETTIKIKPISAKDWAKIIANLGSKASWISKLLIGEIPDDIEAAFTPLKLHLLPHSRDDFKTRCSCPDYSNPCKHIAGVYYLIAAQLDQDPFLLFELRGITRKKLQAELAQSPLGKVLSGALDEQTLTPQAVESCFTRPQKLPLELAPDRREFWLSDQPLPPLTEVTPAAIPAIIVKKGGDFPAFWEADTSFIAVMEELYERVRTKNRKIG